MHARLLRNPENQVSDLAQEVGYPDVSGDFPQFPQLRVMIVPKQVNSNSAGFYVLATVSTKMTVFWQLPLMMMKAARTSATFSSIQLLQ